MPALHVERLRSGEGKEDDYRVIEPAHLLKWEREATFACVGKSHPRVEGEEKVTGRARYAADICLPGLLYAKVLRSPHAHSRLVRIDFSRAAAVPGVMAVLTADNAPPIQWYDHSALFDRTLRFVGDEVAAVAAVSEEAAEDALRLIEVEYEVLGFSLDVVSAQTPGAAEIHEGGNLVDKPKVCARGDLDAGFAAAEITIDHFYETQAALHNCLETHGCTAYWEGEQLTLWESTQSIFDVREEVAEKLGVPEHHVRVIKQFMGGGFGSKQIAWKHAVIAALLAKQAGRPVQLMLDRTAENLAAGNRNPTRQRVRLGAKRDGTLTAMDVHIEQAIGAHKTGGEAADTLGLYQRLYRCENQRVEQVTVYTNTGPAVAFRAPGYVESAFGLESAMDELAVALEMDPVELRLRNYTDDDQKTGKRYSTPESLRLCYDRASEAFDWKGTRERKAYAAAPGKRRGIGFAAHEWGGAGFPPAYAWIKINSDGTADVITGTHDIGTGTRTSLTQIAAEELGYPLEMVSLHLGDTAHGPYAPVSSGSATQATLGPAIRMAAAEARRQLLDAAATVLRVSPRKLEIRDGCFVVEGNGKAVPAGEIMKKIAPHMILGQGVRAENRKDRSIRTFGAQCVEVEVDEETGEVTVLRVVAAHDCGRVINPKLVDSQIVGGVTQGLGFALMEERIIDEATGIPLNANLEEYRVPTVRDIPEIVPVQIDLPDLIANATGAKGVGEPPLIPTAPAIANAVFDAVGVRIREAPLNRQRVLDALANAGP